MTEWVSPLSIKNNPINLNNSNPNIDIKIINYDLEYDWVLSIRKEVFVEEQSVPMDIEVDRFEKLATYVLAFIDNQPVGTARWRKTEFGIKLERFAVLKKFRGMGVGALLLEFILDRIDQNKEIYLNAQESVIAFYEKNGFTCVGKKFYEAHIPHRKMIYTCTPIKD